MTSGSKNYKKIKAFELRKQKKSYREIAKELKVSKGTVSYWFKNIDWSRNIQKQLTKRNQKLWKKRLKHLNNLKKIKYKNLYKQAEDESKKEFIDLKDNKLFIAGIMIYWGEGDRKFDNGIVRVSNVDPKMLAIFKKFLIQVGNIDKKNIKGYILLYPDHKTKECLKFWSQKTGINESNFYKPTVIQGKHQKNRLPYGVCAVSVSNKYFKKKILTWIELLVGEI